MTFEEIEQRAVELNPYIVESSDRMLKIGRAKRDVDAIISSLVESNQEVLQEWFSEKPQKEGKKLFKKSADYYLSEGNPLGKIFTDFITTIRNLVFTGMMRDSIGQYYLEQLRNNGIEVNVNLCSPLSAEKQEEIKIALSRVAELKQHSILQERDCIKSSTNTVNTEIGLDKKNFKDAVKLYTLKSAEELAEMESELHKEISFMEEREGILNYIEGTPLRVIQGIVEAPKVEEVPTQGVARATGVGVLSGFNGGEVNESISRVIPHISRDTSIAIDSPRFTDVDTFVTSEQFQELNRRLDELIAERIR